MKRLSIARIISSAAIVSALCALPAHADVNAGSQAYDRGDYEAARDLLSQEGTSNNRRAQFLLGLMHANGEGGPRDPQAAIQWLERSAGQGYQPAKHALTALRARSKARPTDTSATTAAAQPKTEMKAMSEPKQAASSPPPPAMPANATTGSALLQIGAFGTRTAASRYWASTQAKDPTLLSDVTVDYATGVSANGKEVHRVRIGPFSSSTNARDRCSSLRDRGIVPGCFVVQP